MKRILRCFRKPVVKVLGVVSALMLFSVVAWLFLVVKIYRLPGFYSYQNYRPYQTTYFLARGGEIIGCLAKEWRDVLSAEDLKNLLVAKFMVAVEDKRFSWRPAPAAVDPEATARAAVRNFMAGKTKEGGSTIQQQLVKQLLPIEERAEKSYLRKVREAILGIVLGLRFSKDEMLALYLNQVYLGHQAYGVEAASRLYFGKKARELTIAEAATIAGLPTSPATLSPLSHPVRAQERRNVVLELLHKNGLINQEQYEEALEEQLRVSHEFRGETCARAQHAVDKARLEIKEKIGLSLFDDAGTQDGWFGLRIETTLDGDLQYYAEEGLWTALEAYEERQGDEAIDAEGAVLAMEHNSGAILALVGGKDYSLRKFNHATQGRRQPGSGFKPVVYAAHIERELLRGVPYDKILDGTVANWHIRCKGSKPGEYWEPKNFDEKKFSKAFYTLRFALAQSINRAAVHLGRVDRCGLNPSVIEMANRLGIDLPQDARLPVVLGAHGVSLATMTTVYATFASGGIRPEPFLVTKITDAKGKVLYQRVPSVGKRVVSEMVAALMTELLRGTVKFGTARSLSRLKQPLACKTGTTERYVDALIFCYTPYVTMGVWIGGPEDTKQSLGDRQTGGNTAGPVIREMLENWYKDYEPDLFPQDVEGWMKAFADPDLFKKELESIKNADPDVEAPQE